MQPIRDPFLDDMQRKAEADIAALPPCDSEQYVHAVTTLAEHSRDLFLRSISEMQQHGVTSQVRNAAAVLLAIHRAIVPRDSAEIAKLRQHIGDRLDALQEAIGSAASS